MSNVHGLKKANYLTLENIRSKKSLLLYILQFFLSIKMNEEREVT